MARAFHGTNILSSFLPVQWHDGTWYPPNNTVLPVEQSALVPFNGKFDSFLPAAFQPERVRIQALLFTYIV
jgi:hypothetical protein